MADQPYETQRQAHAAAVAAIPPGPGQIILNHAQNSQLLRRALDDAGVTTGAFDEQIVSWLANYEDSTVAVIAGWITRAAQSHGEAVTHWGVRYPGEPEVREYDDEEDARRHLIAEEVVVSREVAAGPWTEIPEAR